MPTPSLARSDEPDANGSIGTICAQTAKAGLLPNCVLSVIAAYVVFGGRIDIPVTGWGGIAFDVLPQSGLIAFMTFFMTMASVARSRKLVSRWLLPALGRSIGLAVIVAALGFALSWVALTTLSPPHWTVSEVLVFKASYGVFLGLLLARPASQIALRHSAAPSKVT